MTPLPNDPNVVVLVQNGTVTASATNVAPNLVVVDTQFPELFAKYAKGMPFVAYSNTVVVEPVRM